MRRSLLAVTVSVLWTSLVVPFADAKLSSNNRRAVVLETFYALRPSHDGGCDMNKTIGGRCVSNWNYLTNDTSAYNVVKNFYGCAFASEWKVSGDGCGSGWPASFFNNPGSYGYGNFGGTANPVGRGGQCKYFVDLILYRSETQARINGTHTLPPYAEMLNSSTTNFTGVKEGDIIFTYGSGITNHVAIVVEIKRDVFGAITGVDVIDSNFVSDTGAPNREVIGRHLFLISHLQSYYRIWTGTSYYGEPYIP